MLPSGLTRIERVDDCGAAASRMLARCGGLGGLIVDGPVGIAVEQVVHNVLQSHGCGAVYTCGPVIKGDGMVSACRREAVWLSSRRSCSTAAGMRPSPRYLGLKFG